MTMMTKMPAAVDRRGVVWSTLAAALMIAIVVWPAAIAGWTSGTHLSVAALAGTVASGFGRWVESGRASSSPLAAAVSYWAVFHAVKAIVAVALLVVLVPVGQRIWAAHARTPSRRRRVGLLVTGLLGAPIAPIVLLVAMANVQGAVAPLSSVLNFLPLDGPSVLQVRGELAAGRMTPPLTVLIEDFRLYHAALVGTAVAAIVVVVAGTVAIWVQRARAPRLDRRLRRVLACGGILLPGMLPFLGVVLLANMSTVADTAPALAAFLDGSGM